MNDQWFITTCRAASVSAGPAVGEVATGAVVVVGLAATAGLVCLRFGAGVTSEPAEPALARVEGAVPGLGVMAAAGLAVVLIVGALAGLEPVASRITAAITPTARNPAATRPTISPVFVRRGWG